MKKYTQEEFDKIEVVDGYKICPTGDYTAIKVFGEDCSFGEDCIIEGNKKLINFIKFDGFGSGDRPAYFFNTQDGIYVRCGCFSGWIDEFAMQVKLTYGDSSCAKEYLMLVDVAKFKFESKES